MAQIKSFFTFNDIKTGDSSCFLFENPIWTASSDFGTYRLCEQRRFRRACASAQSRQNLCCSLIPAVSQEEPSDRKPDPWPLWMAGHAQLKLKFVMTECSKIQIRLMGLIYRSTVLCVTNLLNDLYATGAKPAVVAYKKSIFRVKYQ